MSETCLFLTIQASSTIYKGDFSFPMELGGPWGCKEWESVFTPNCCCTESPVGVLFGIFPCVYGDPIHVCYIVMVLL